MKQLKTAQTRTELYKTQATPLITEKQQNSPYGSKLLKTAQIGSKRHGSLQNVSYTNNIIKNCKTQNAAQGGLKRHGTSQDTGHTANSRKNIKTQKAAQNGLKRLKSARKGTEVHKTQATQTI
jgi:hypothetical protein